MFKKMVMVLVLLALALGLSGFALAQTEFKELKLTSVREEPVNLLSYTASGLDFIAEVIKRLVESGKPAVIFREEIAGGLEVTLIEGLFNKPLDLVGGATFMDEEPVDFLWGLQYTGLHSKSGGIWDWFSRFEPAVYNIGGEWYLGLVYEFRE